MRPGGEWQFWVTRQMVKWQSCVLGASVGSFSLREQLRRNCARRDSSAAENKVSELESEMVMDAFCAQNDSLHAIKR